VLFGVRDWAERDLIASRWPCGYAPPTQIVLVPVAAASPQLLLLSQTSPRQRLLLLARPWPAYKIPGMSITPAASALALVVTPAASAPASMSFASTPLTPPSSTLDMGPVAAELARIANSDPDPDQALLALAPYLAPFDDDDADVVVRSSDGVDFRLYRAILRKASHAFRDLFAPPALATDAVRDGLPVVPFADDARTLRLLFTHIYPITRPELRDAVDIRALLRALDKYCVVSQGAASERLVLDLAERAPELAYALACRFRLPADIARRAARLTLRKPAGLTMLSEEDAAHIPGLMYHRLILYQTRAVGAAALAVKTFPWPSVDRPAAPTPVPTIDLCVCRRLGFVAEPGGKVATTMPFWLMDYRSKCLGALQKVPVGAIVLEPELLFQTVGMYAQPSVCAECARRISGPLHAFCKTLAAEVDRRVAEVRCRFCRMDAMRLLTAPQVTLEVDY
jgi:hypothetical protein